MGNKSAMKERCYINATIHRKKVVFVTTHNASVHTIEGVLLNVKKKRNGHETKHRQR